MMIKFDQIDLDGMYFKAKIAFKDCIADKNNEFLRMEIQVPLDEIVTKDEWVRIQFFKSNKEHYIIETKILLLSKNREEIGWYSYHEDENGNVVDDFLVFE